MKSTIATTWIFFLMLILFVSFSSCKKCVTCRAYDSANGDIKFEETSCANGPLQDDWEAGIQIAYPSPQYNTVCK